jgi:hypothetical protein
VEEWLKTVSENYMLSADDEYYYSLILLPPTPEWGEFDKVRLKVFDIQEERPACIFVRQGLQNVYDFVKGKELLVNQLFPKNLDAGEKKRLLDGEFLNCSHQYNSVWMVDENRPEWAVTRGEWKAIKACTIERPMDGAKTMWEAETLQSRMTEKQWKRQKWMEG